MSTKLPVWGTIREAWQQTYGAKGQLWIGLIIMFAITIGLQIIQHPMSSIAGVINLISLIITYLLRAGLTYMGILRARNMPVNYRQVFHGFNWGMTWKIIMVYLLQFIISLPFIALFGAAIFALKFATAAYIGYLITAISILGFVYIEIRLSLAMCYVIDSSQSPINALKLSFIATRGQFLSLIGIFALLSMLILLSILPFFIGLIWTLPFSYVVYGMIYQKLLNQQC